MSAHRIHIDNLSDWIGHGLSGDGSTREAIPVTIEGNEFRHAVKSKRQRVGDGLALFDGRGLVARGTIASIGSRRMVVNVSRYRTVSRLRPEIVMAVPPPKGTRPEVMVDQLSQVGVGVWVPLLTERTIVTPREGKQDRWHRVAVESAKQSGRSWIMDIAEPVTLRDLAGWIAQAYGSADHGVAYVVADPTGDKPRDVMAKSLSSHVVAETVVMIVGPEGGLSPADDEVIASWGVPVSRMRIAPHVLRVGTAAVAAATLGRAVLWGGE